MGKTSLAAAARVMAEPDFRITSSHGDPMETSLPLGVMTQTLGGLDGSSILATEVPAPAPEIRATRFYRVLQFLKELSGPTLLLLDDLQWSDPDSLALIAFITKRIDKLPVVIVGTLRPWPDAAHGLAIERSRGGDATFIRLQPLSNEAAGVLIHREATVPVTQAAMERAVALSGGNPLILQEMAHAIARGEILPAPDGDRRAPATNEFILARFSQLPEGAVRIARAASALGVSFYADVAIEVSDLQGRAADIALEALWISGILRPGSDARLEFVHPLLCQLLYEDIPPPVRVRIHARAFGVLMHQGQVARAALHVARGNLAGDAGARAAVHASAVEALRVGAPESAATQLLEVLHGAGDVVESGLLVVLVEALTAVGRVREAADVCERLLARENVADVDRAVALRALGRLAYLQRDHDKAADSFRDAVQLVQESHPEIASQALIDQVLSDAFFGGPAQTLALAEQALRLSRHASRVLRRRATAAWGFAALQAGDPEGFAALSKLNSQAGAPRLQGEDDPYWSWSPAMAFGIAATYVEEFDAAEAAMRHLQETAERLGVPSILAPVANFWMMSALRRGQLEDVFAWSERAGALGDLTPMTLTYRDAFLAVALLLKGRVADSARLCERIEATLTPGREGIVGCWVWHARGMREVREGKAEQASRTYRQIEATFDRMGIGEPCFVPWARHGIAAHVAAGAVDDAQRLVDWLDGAAARLPCRWPRIVAMAGRGDLAAQRGDMGTAEEAFRAAIAMHDDLPLPLERAETLLAYGRVLRRSGHPARSRPLLREALDLAHAAGCDWLEGIAAEQLAVAGGRRGRAHSRDLTGSSRAS